MAKIIVGLIVTTSVFAMNGCISVPTAQLRPLETITYETSSSGPRRDALQTHEWERIRTALRRFAERKSLRRRRLGS